MGDMILQLFLAGAVGLALGSFGNVFLYRIRANTSLSGRSSCPACKKTLRWYDLFPVVSFLFLRGRCRSCKAKISVQYPLIELLSCVVFLLALFLHAGDPLTGYLSGFFLYFLLLACVYDTLYEEIPDVFTIGAAIIAVCAIVFLEKDIVSAILGMTVAGAWFGAQWLLSRGKAVGSGDIFLAAAIGLFLGFYDTVIMLLLSYMTGAVVVVTLLFLKKITLNKGTRIAFGPFLGVATILVMVGVGDAYLSLLQ